MTSDQVAAAKSLKRALGKVVKSGMILRVFDGDVWVCPEGVNLWPQGSEGNVMAVLYEHGQNVKPDGLDADGGAGV